MPIGKIAPRRELGAFGSQQAQLQGQDAARAANDAKRRLDAQILLALAAPFRTNSQQFLPTKLLFNVKKGDLWFIEFWGRGRSAGAGGINYAVGAPTGSIIQGTLESSTVNTGVANWFILDFSNINTGIGACHAGASDVGRPDRLAARVECVSDGKIGIAAATVTAASFSTIEAQAFLRATRYTKVF